MHRFQKKTTNDDFRFVATTPQTNLRFFVYLVWLSSFSFFTLFLQMCWANSYFKGIEIAKKTTLNKTTRKEKFYQIMKNALL